MGVGVINRQQGLADPALLELPFANILCQADVESVGLWILSHRDMRKSARVNAFSRFIAGHYGEDGCAAKGAAKDAKTKVRRVTMKPTLSSIAGRRHMSGHYRPIASVSAVAGFVVGLPTASKNASPYRSSFIGPTPETAKSSSGVDGRNSAMARRVLSLKTM